MHFRIKALNLYKSNVITNWIALKNKPKVLQIKTPSPEINRLEAAIYVRLYQQDSKAHQIINRRAEK